MKAIQKILSWFKEQSSALQGIAAVVVICGALIATWRLLRPFLGPALVLQQEWHESTLPPGIAEWTRDVAYGLAQLPEPKDREDNFLTELRALANSRFGKKPRVDTYLSQDTGKYSLIVSNRSERVINNIRVRIDDIRDIWSVEVRGKYLTAEEIQDFNRKLSAHQDGTSVVLPELPPLPPNGAVILDIYGSGRFAKAELSAPGESYSSENIVRLRENWLLALYQQPFILMSVVPPIITILAVLFVSLFSKPHPWRVLYNFACEQALTGHTDIAIGALRKAKELNPDVLELARKDSDMQNIKDRLDSADLD